MTNRPLDRDEIEALKKIVSGLKLRHNDWLGGHLFWSDVKRNVDAMLTSGTNDGEDIVDELTDEDAKERPWVMCRDDQNGEWVGPHKLVAVKNVMPKFVVIRSDCSRGYEVSTTYIFARPLTTEEKARYGK